MDAQQEIFSEMLVRLRDLHYDVYDGKLPPDDVAYPFIYMSDAHQVDIGTKGTLTGQVTLTFDVYHDKYHQRGTVSQILSVIKTVARSIEKTDTHGWYVPAQGVETRIMPDTTTRTPLLHGVLFVTFRFS